MCLLFFFVLKDNKQLVPRHGKFGFSKKECRQLEAFIIADNVAEKSILQNMYQFRLTKLTVCGILDEERFPCQIYWNLVIYSSLGVEMSICIDIAMAKGGT